jgi:hypothetical protein
LEPGDRKLPDPDAEPGTARSHLIVYGWVTEQAVAALEPPPGRAHRKAVPSVSRIEPEWLSRPVGEALLSVAPADPILFVRRCAGGDNAVRSLQDFLLMIGATALGSVWGCLAIALVGAFTVFRARSGEDWGTYYGVMYSGFCCGVPLGALAGLVCARQVAQDARENWSPIVWIGVVVGVALGPIMSYYVGMSQVKFDLMNVLIIAVATAMFGTVGGMLAATGEGIWRRATKGRSRFLATGLGLFFAFIPTVLMLVLATLLVSRQLTGFQLAWSILIGVPILCGFVTWLRRDGKQIGVRKQEDIRNRYRA